MKLFAAVWVVIVVGCLPALGQTITVRSGEHAEFSRLALDFPGKTPWNLTTDGTSSVLIFPKGNFRFDTSHVFDRIPRSRVNQIAALQNGLKLDLGCGCNVSAYWLGEKMLVVDILDEAEKENASIPVPSGRDSKREKPGTKMIPFPLSPPGGLFSRKLMVDALPEVYKPFERSGLSGSTDPAGQDIIKKTRRQLLRQLGRATSQGLLSLEQPQKGRQPLAGVKSKAEKLFPTKPGNSAAANVKLGEHVNVRAQTSIDRDFLNRLQSEETPEQPVACLENGMIDLLAWGGTGTIDETIGALRKNLTGEFDRINEKAVLDLAKLYVHFGFGAEALQVLKLSSNKSELTKLVAEMAHILEYGPGPQVSNLGSYIECSGQEGLWAALSLNTLPDDAIIDGNALLINFNALPPYLRRDLGPDLARKLFQSGRGVAGEKVLRILARKTETVTPKGEALKEEFFPARKNNFVQENGHDIVIPPEARKSPETLVRIINEEIAGNAEISYETAQLAGAYTQELRGTPLGREMAKAYLGALASSGAFDESFRELTRLQPAIPDTDVSDILNVIYSALSGQADELTFLRLATAIDPGVQTRLRPDISNEIANRLLKAGFPLKARDFARDSAPSAYERQRAILRAKASLQLRKPRQAEVDLLGFSGKDINMLRAEARSMAGAYDAAYEYFTASEDWQNAGHAAWMNEDWSHVGLSGDSGLTNFAAWMSSSASAAASNMTASTGVLARDKKLVVASQEARKALRALLDTRPMPASDDL